jgi:hypothetical protein
MSTTVQMIDSYPDGAGGTYKKGSIYTLSDDALVAWFINTNRARKTVGVSERTGDGYALEADGADFSNQRLTQAEVLAARNGGALKNVGGITEAQTMTISGGAIGERRTLTDGGAAGSEVVWAIPQGQTFAAWCWGIFPTASYN